MRGEDGRVERLLVLRGREDDPAARAAQRLVRRARDEVGDAHRVGIEARGHQAGVVRHVDHEQRAHLVGDVAEALPVGAQRVGGGAGHDHARVELAREVAHLVVVDLLGLAQAVGHGVVELAGEVHRRAVREVAAVRERHAEDRVAGLEHGHVDGLVRLRARVRLHVGVLRAEELLHALDGEALGHVDELAAAVVALAGVALRVLVGEDRSLRGHHRGTRVVLGGDEFEAVFLAPVLVADGLPDFGVDGGDGCAYRRTWTRPGTAGTSAK